MSADKLAVENELLRRLEQFDAKWQSGETVEINEFLPTADGVLTRRELLAELIMLDLEYRWRKCMANQSPSTKDEAQRQRTLPDLPVLEDYVARYPDVGQLEDLPVHLIADEYRVRHRWGDRPPREEYLSRFPGRDEALRAALSDIDELLSSQSQSSGLRTRCPHCHESISLDDDAEFAEICCPCCGSRFNILADESRVGGRESASIAHFDLVEQLGSGSFGTVWKARDRQLDRVVAVKIPRYGRLDAEEVDQFLREARAAGQLNHPNIVTVHEVGRDGTLVYIVSDWVDGVALSDLLATQQMTFRDVATLCARIADALHHAHETGIIHRDLKPQNIVVDAEGEPHLLDFGLAKRVTGEITVTVDGKLIGTPAYMSPEQARGEAHRADRRTDVYSLGAILFELLTGEKPFRGDAHTVMQQIIDEDATSPRKLNSKIPRDLETICLRCLQKEPPRRFTTAKELAQELRRYLRGEPIHARRISAIARGWRWCRRNPVVATLGVTIASLLLFLAIAGPIVAIRQTSLAAKEAAAREETRRHLYVSDMNSALQAWSVGSVGHALDLLQRHVPREQEKDLRRFEWFYLWRLCQQSVNATKLKHAAPVTLIACSVDGDRLASAAAADESGTVEVKLWHAGAHEAAKSLRFEINDALVTGAFCPHLRRFAGATKNGTVHIWELPTGTKRILLRPHMVRINSIAFANDAKRLASQMVDNSIVLWDLETGGKLRTLVAREKPAAHAMPPAWTGSLAFSPDDQTLASGGVSGTITLWQPDTGEELDTLRGHSASINCVTFSPDGSRLATASDDTTVKLWDTANHEELYTLSGHKNSATCVAFSASASAAASAGRDNVVIVWDVLTGQSRTVLKGHKNWVNALAFFAGGDQVASGSHDTTVKLWSLNAQSEKDVLNGHAGAVWSVSLSPTGKTLASAGVDATIRLWDVTTGDALTTMHGHTDSVYSVDFSPRGKTLASGSWDGTVRIWNVSTGRDSHTLVGHQGKVYGVAFRPDGQQVASGGADSVVNLWEVATGTQRNTLRGHKAAVVSVAYSPTDDELLASGSWDGTVKLWNLNTMKSRTLVGHAGRVFHVAFSPDGAVLASAGADTLVKLWDVATGDFLGDLTGHASWVMAVSFSPDGTTLVSGESGSAIKLWDMAAREERVTLDGHTRGVSTVTFSADGNILASSSADQTVRLWRAARNDDGS